LYKVRALGRCTAALAIITVMLLAGLSPTLTYQDPTASTVDQRLLELLILKYGADLKMRIAKIDEYLEPIVEHYKAHYEALTQNHGVQNARKHENSQERNLEDVEDVIEMIYVYNKDDVKAIIKDITILAILMSKMKDKSRLAKILIKLGYTPEQARRIAQMISAHPVNADYLWKSYRMIVSNDALLKMFTEYIVYEEVKHLLGVDRSYYLSS